WNVRLSPTNSHLNAIACGKRQIVAVGADSTILVFGDGGTWRRVEVPDRGLTFNAVAYGNGWFGIAGDKADFYSYDEGTNWTRLTGGFQGKTIYGLAYGTSGFVGVGVVNSNQQPAVFTDYRGWSWPALTATTRNILRAVTYGQNE